VSGDVEAPAVAAGLRGRAVVVFTEWLRHHLLLRVATHTRSGWSLATLDRSLLPIWSQRTTISSNGTVFVVWIDELGSHRKLIAAELTPGHRWDTRTVLDEGDGLGSIVLSSGAGNLVAAAWHDSLASEARVRVAINTNGTWHSAATLARSLGLLDTVRFGGKNARIVSWRLWDAGRGTFFRAIRHGLVWRRAVPTLTQGRSAHAEELRG
jgi:hypothetical protein